MNDTYFTDKLANLILEKCLTISSGGFTTVLKNREIELHPIDGTIFQLNITELIKVFDVYFDFMISPFTRIVDSNKVCFAVNGLFEGRLLVVRIYYS